MSKLSIKISFILVSIVILTIQPVVNGVRLSCNYGETFYFDPDEYLFYCFVSDSEIFTDERVIIDSVAEITYEGLTNDDITGIIISSIPSLRFVPRDLQTIFGNIIVIQVYHTNLQEIKQEDIKVFPKLQKILLFNNKITTIDANLFEFNPKLTDIKLSGNQISHIDPNVFNHLNNLTTLWLSGNNCKYNLSDVSNSRSEVLKLVKRVRNAECSNDNIIQHDYLLNSAGSSKIMFFEYNYHLFWLIAFLVQYVIYNVLF